MVRVSYNQQPYRRIIMETHGAEIHASPTDLTQAGCDMLEEHPDSPGSLGIAISEAVEDAKYSLGSVLNHVLLLRAVFSRRTHRPRALLGGDREGRRQHTGLGRRKWPGSTAPSRTYGGRERIRDVRDRCVR
jgi:hypothetical protein